MRRWSLLAVMWLAFGLRVLRLDFQELRGDEAFGYFFSLPPIAEIVGQTLALQEPHPVGSYLVQHVWLAGAGESEFALRFVGVWFGVLAVALIYRLGRALELSNPNALIAALLLAVSPYAVWHSQDARMYSMSLALTIASTCLTAMWVRRGERHRARWAVAAGYVAVNWLALHTHYFAAFVILAQNLFVLTWIAAAYRQHARRWRIDLLAWLSLQAILTLLYLPWLWRARTILTGYRGNGDSPGLLEMLTRAFGAFAVGESMPPMWPTLFAALAAALLLMGAVRLWRAGDMGRRALLLLLLYLLVPLAATWFSALRRPIFDERYLIAAVPPFYLLIAAAVPERIARPLPPLLSLRWAPISLFLLGFLLGGMGISLANYYTDPAYSKSVGWRALAAAFERLSAGLPPERVRLVENFPDPTLWYYYDGPVDHLVLPPAPHDQAGAARAVAALDGVQRVVLVVQPAPNWDDSGIAAAALAEQYQPVAETQAGAWPVQVYVHPPDEMAPMDVRFENGVTLDRAAFAPSTVAPGGLLVVHLAWRGDSPQLSGTEKVFVHVVGADGAPIAQADQPLIWPAMSTDPDEPFVTSYGILISDGTPADSYRLIAGIYDPAQAEAPRMRTSTGSDSAELGAIDVNGQSYDESRNR